MPSGITSKIYDGEDVSLRDYLMTVGRQMSMAIMQRDEGPGPVKLRKPSTYSLDALEQAILERHRLADLTEAECADEAAAEFLRSREARREYKERKDALRARYQAMYEKVEAWEPDPKVEYVKGHALKYLRESIEFDCPEGRDIWPPDQDEPTPWGKWRDEKIAECERQIERYSEQWDEEVERVNDFNEHILAFHRSLPDE
jgi:hypothetical protein